MIVFLPRLIQITSITFLASLLLTLRSTNLNAALTGSAWTDGHGHIEYSYVPVDPLFPLGPKHLDLGWHIGEGFGSTIVGLPLIYSQEFEAPDIYPVVPLISNSNFLRPTGSNWDFTGTTSGSPLFVIPLMVPPQNEVLPRLGIADGSLVFADWVGGSVNVTFSLSNSAPGSFSVFDGDSSTPIPRYASAGGTPASFVQGLGHYHHNYAFTAPGAYDIQLTIAGTHATDGPQSATQIFQFFVGDIASVPEPSSAALLSLAALVGAHLRRRVR